MCFKVTLKTKNVISSSWTISVEIFWGSTYKTKYEGAKGYLQEFGRKLRLLQHDASLVKNKSNCILILYSFGKHIKFTQRRKLLNKKEQYWFSRKKSIGESEKQ